jgi:hypothetical protein
MRLLTNNPRDIELAIRATRDEPFRLASYASPASLPRAADWRFGVVHVASIDVIAFSDGTNWYPLSKGAAL